MDFGLRLTFNSGGEQMLLFGAGSGFLGGSPDGRCKRPFVVTTVQEELEEELYGSVGLEVEEKQGPERKRRLTAEQVRALERSFEEEKRKLEPERKSELARRLGMAPRQVALWFQNRRARWKAKQLELDFDRLRAAHDELLAGRDALLADNHRLRSQVASLTEKLQAKVESPSPSSEPDEKTAASATAHGAAAAAERHAVQLEGGDYACAEARNGTGASESPESYFACARSSEDDCGGLSDGFFLSETMLDVAAEEEVAHLSSWAWFWN